MAAAIGGVKGARNKPDGVSRGRLRGAHHKGIALSNTTLGVLMATINSSIILISSLGIFRGIGIDVLPPGNVGYAGFAVFTIASVIVAFNAMKGGGGISSPFHHGRRFVRADDDAPAAHGHSRALEPGLEPAVARVVGEHAVAHVVREHATDSGSVSGSLRGELAMEDDRL